MKKSIKKRNIAYAAVIAAITAALSSCSNDAASVGIIGGSDGPTAVYVTDGKTKLYESRHSYIGDVSAIGAVTKNLAFPESMVFDGTELNTTRAPYGMTMFYSGDITAEDEFNLENNAALMFALIDNCSNITFKNKDSNRGITFTRDKTDKRLGSPVSEYSETPEKLSELIELLKIPARDDDTLISKAILTHNSGGFADGECCAEGHIVLGNAEDGGNRIFYLLTSYGEYGFENGNFIKTSGTGIIPVRLTFDENNEPIEYKEPTDGAEYINSLKEIFPAEYHARIFHENADYEDDYHALLDQEHIYADAYLKSINHDDCAIGEYADFEHTLTEELDVSVSNSLLDLFYEYPFWLGTAEKVEDGKRYVYEHKQDVYENVKTVVTYRKYSYHSGDIAEETVIEVNGTDITYVKGEPRESRR
ncbi:MAG: DUF4825 domain-containing protein [Oscillospiraceae bacterium]|nr:DUF4825 domain-containing protein [Oscillospiraceae bacterium]